MGPLVTVPALAAAVLEQCGGTMDGWRRHLTAAAGNPEVCEVDLAGLAGTAPDSAALLAEWWLDCQAFWEAVAQRRWAGRFLQLRRPLVRHSIGDRRDMRAELSALERVPQLAPMVSAATAGDPDWQYLAGLAEVADGGADERSGRVWTVAVGGESWPALLGGPGMPGLLARHVTVGVTHAAWRDRRSRRLTFVQVDAVEWWPQPTRLPAAG